MNNKILYLMGILCIPTLLLFCNPLVNAIDDIDKEMIDLGSFPVNTSFNITSICQINLTLCSASAVGDIWIFYGNSTNVISNYSMIYNNGYYYYSVPYHQPRGNYYGYIRYDDQGQSSYKKFTFNIGSTYNQIDMFTCPNTSNMIAVFSIMIIIILFIMFLGFKYKNPFFSILSGVSMWVLSPTFYSCNYWMGVLTFVLGMFIIIMGAGMVKLAGSRKR